MRNRAGLVATLTTLLLVAGGCGTDTAPDHGQLAVASAATAEAGSARIDATFTMTSPMFESTMRMTGVVDIAAEAAHMSMEVDFGNQGGVSTGEIIVIDGFQYVRGMVDGQDLPGFDDGMWMRQPLPETAAGWTDPMSGGDPTGMLDVLGDLGRPVEQVGTDQVRDVGTTHYRVEATMEDLLRVHEAELQEQVELPAGTDTTAIPVVLEVWVDGDDLVRRMRTEMDMTAATAEMPGGGGELQSIMDMEFYDFGVAVDITAPPDDEVVDHDPMVGPSPADEPDLGLSWEDSDTFTDEIVVEDRPEGVPDGFPEFPFHPTAVVMGATDSPDDYELRMWILTFGEEPLDQIVAFHERELPLRGWEVTGRAGDPAQERFDISGHGWTGSVQISEAPDSSEVTVEVTLTR